MDDNIDYSEKWLLIQLLKQHKIDPNKKIILKKVDLLKIVLDFVKLNREN